MYQALHTFLVINKDDGDKIPFKFIAHRSQRFDFTKGASINSKNPQKISTTMLIPLAPKMKHKHHYNLLRPNRHQEHRTYLKMSV